MVKDDQQQSYQDLPMKMTGAKYTGLAVAVAAVAIAVVFVATRRPHQAQGQESPPATTSAAAAAPPGDRLFQGWTKPDVALVLSGQEHGYLQPCGCSEPQKGGLARRYNFMRTLTKDRGWPIVAGDLGDIAQRTGPQAKLKYRVFMEALKLLEYTAIGIGENETTLPLFNALGEYALNNPSPRVVAANLANRETNFPGMVAAWQVSARADAPRVGFIGVVAPSVAGAIQDPDVHFDPIENALPAALQQIQGQRPELLVLLYQGTEKEAEACARKFKQFHVILCSSNEEEPSGRPNHVGKTLIVNVGHKGRYVGVVGAYRNNNGGFDLRYEFVSLDPEYETPEGQDATNPIHALLQKYAEEVRDQNYLAKYVRDARHPVQVAFPEATYAGSEKCRKCHQTAYEIWKNSPHPHAFEALVVKARRPTLRQYDGECVQCHVTGFGYKTGYMDDQATPKLKGVGCESCHGPASLHAAKPENEQYRAALMPWRGDKGEQRAVIINKIDKACQKCHDPDNDVHFKFEERWKKIVHNNPKD
jgi:hypothetical protein